MEPRPGFESGILRTWADEGFFHLPGFFTETEISLAAGVLEETWRSRPRDVTVDDIETGRRCRIADIHADDRTHRLKVSDLYLVSRELREMLLSESLVSLLAQLLSDTPVLCNTLHLEKSSAQDYHADALFMTPRTPGQLVAGWIALEDVRPGSGPLRLYPGSHRIARYRFSDGGHHAVDKEMPRWGEYMQKELDRRALPSQSIQASKGDLVLWHADLLHGAEPIGDTALTRRSLVAHYFSLEDSRRRGYRLARAGRGLWVRRRPQPVDTVSRLLCAADRRLESLRGRFVRR